MLNINRLATDKGSDQLTTTSLLKAFIAIFLAVLLAIARGLAFATCESESVASESSSFEQDVVDSQQEGSNEDSTDQTDVDKSEALEGIAPELDDADESGAALDSSDAANNSTSTVLSTLSTESDARSATTLDEVVAQYKKACEAAGRTSEYDKAIYVHDTFMSNCTYDASSALSSVEDALLGRRANAEGFQNGFAYLLQSMGIPTKPARDPSSGAVWTLAYLDKKWTHIDVLADNVENPPQDYYLHLYFGLNDTQIKYLHPGYEPQGNPAATSRDNNYFIRAKGTNDYRQAYAEIATQITNHINNKEKEFEFAPPKSSEPNIYNIIYDSLAIAMDQTVINGVRVSVSFANTSSNDKSGCKFQVKVDPAKITASAVKNIYDMTYTGREVLQNNMYVEVGGKVLNRGLDYSVKYSNNVIAGTASVTITGNGTTYEGTVTKTFKINRASVA